jgi:hypothetical protein
MKYTLETIYDEEDEGDESRRVDDEWGRNGGKGRALLIDVGGVT